MSKPIIAIKVSPRDYAGLINLGTRVGASLLGNASFTTPFPALTVLTADLASVTTAIGLWGPKGNRGSHDQLVDLRTKALTLAQTLKSLAQYVQNTAQTMAGSDYTAMAAIINTSGFSLRNANSPQGRLEMVQNFRQFVSRKLSNNQVKLKWKKPLNTINGNNVKSYKVYRGTTNVFASAAIVDTITKTSFIDTNTSGAPVTWSYWVVAVNNAGDSVPTADVTLTVVSA